MSYLQFPEDSYEEEAIIKDLKYYQNEIPNLLINKIFIHIKSNKIFVDHWQRLCEHEQFYNLVTSKPIQIFHKFYNITDQHENNIMKIIETYNTSY